jgi:hypothetical protein
MKTLAELTVGDKVVVSGGSWSSVDSVHVVDASTTARITVSGTVFQRSTGNGPAVGGRAFGETRLRIRPATDDDVKADVNRKRRNRALAEIAKAVWDDHSTATIVGVLAVLKAGAKACKCGSEDVRLRATYPPDSNPVTGRPVVSLACDACWQAEIDARHKAAEESAKGRQ